MTTLEETKLEKLLIFSNSAIFHAFFRKSIGPTVTVYVGKSSSGSNCHIVTVGPRFWGYKCSFLGWTNSSSIFGFGLGLFVTRTKQTADRLSLGLTVWVELSLGLNVGGLNIKAPYRQTKRIGYKTYRRHNVSPTKCIGGQNVSADKMYRQTKHISGQNISVDKMFWQILKKFELIFKKHFHHF
jgi:hypothetical protein